MTSNKIKKSLTWIVWLGPVHGADHFKSVLFKSTFLKMGVIWTTLANNFNNGMSS